MADDETNLANAKVNDTMKLYFSLAAAAALFIARYIDSDIEPGWLDVAIYD